jgi:hypothetical protein
MLGGANEAGVCRALVLVWLSQGGGAPPEPTTSNLGANVKEILSSDSLVNCGVHTLGMRWAGDATNLPSLVESKEMSIAIKILETGRYLIGVAGDSAGGHAIGAIIRGTDNCDFFDPNTRYWASEPAMMVTLFSGSQGQALAKRYGATQCAIYKFQL